MPVIPIMAFSLSFGVLRCEICSETLSVDLDADQLQPFCHHSCLFHTVTPAREVESTTEVVRLKLDAFN